MAFGVLIIDMLTKSENVTLAASRKIRVALED